MKNTMKGLKDLIPATIRHMGMTKDFNGHVVVMRWPEIVGSENAAHCRALSVQRGVVLVEVDSPVWGHHLSMMKREMIAKANELIGEKLIEDIRFKAGYFKDSQNNQQDGELSPVQEIPALWQVRLSTGERAWLEETVKSTADPALRRKMTRILRKELALRKLRKEKSWHKCSACNALCPPQDALCTTCNLHKREGMVVRLLEMLREIPWLRYAEAAEQLSCNRQEYQAACEITLSRLASALYHGDTDRMTVSSYLMIKTGAKPENVTEGAIQKVLDGFRRKKKDVSTPGSGYGGSPARSNRHK